MKFVDLFYKKLEEELKNCEMEAIDEISFKLNVEEINKITQEEFDDGIFMALISAENDFNVRLAGNFDVIENGKVNSEIEFNFTVYPD